MKESLTSPFPAFRIGKRPSTAPGERQLSIVADGRSVKFVGYRPIRSALAGGCGGQEALYRE